MSESQLKETRHSRHTNDLDSDNESYESYESYNSYEDSLKDYDKPLKKKQKKTSDIKNTHYKNDLIKKEVSDDTTLLDDFCDYLIMHKSLSTSTSKKHFNNMLKISKRKSYFNIVSLLDIPKNYEAISKHELIEPNHRTSIDYFNSFLEYKFPENCSQFKTVQPMTCTITFHNILYKEGMAISLLKN